MERKARSRGFASMAENKQREIARKGGRAAHEKGRAHEFTSEEARQAGRKGGEKVSVDRSHMAEIGRRGGKSSASRRRRASTGNPGTTKAGASGRDMVLERTVSDDLDLAAGTGVALNGEQTTEMPIPLEETRDGQNPVAGI